MSAGTRGLSHRDACRSEGEHLSGLNMRAPVWRALCGATEVPNVDTKPGGGGANGMYSSRIA